MARGSRLATARRAEDEKHRTLTAALRLPEDQAAGIAEHLAGVRMACLATLQDRDEASFKHREALARINVLSEVAKLAGVSAGKVRASKGKAPKPASGESADTFIAYLRQIVTPDGWEKTLGAKLTEAADSALSKALIGDQLERNVMLYQECLELHRHLCNIDRDGAEAAARMKSLMLRVANG